jgi:hypothetical protein
VLRLKNRFVLWLLLVPLICSSVPSCFGQSSRPKKVSISGIGNPEFPTGFWASRSDPHFGHRMDKLFWLSADRVATTFFKEYRCETGAIYGVRYGAAIFNLAGKATATHEWTAMCDSPFQLGGLLGAFWVQRKDSVDVLRSDFTVTGQISLPKQSHPVWSKSGHGVAVQNGTTISECRSAESLLQPRRSAFPKRSDLMKDQSVAYCFLSFSPHWEI